MEVPIHPVSIPQPSLLINNLYIQILHINFGKDASFRVELHVEGMIEYLDKPLIKIITIEGQEYLNWGGGVNGDDYIINLICQKLGVQRK